MNKGKIIGLIAVLAVAGAALYGADTAIPKGVQPLMVQGAFYTPSWSCIYLKGSDELKLKYKPNAWNTYSIKVTKDATTYDGTNGNFSNMNVFRIKSNTDKPSKDVVLVIDNVKIVDGKGKTVYFLDFEDGKSGDVSKTQGRPAADNGTVVEVGGKKGLMLHMKSENMYGYNGLEAQWTLPAAPDGAAGYDLNGGDWTVTYDYYISVE
ncbi:MAG: hypothetical protein JXP39_02450 [Spirochaetales bacterium]|nr:hypothetical protein [Spirochaetales bacterium]